MKWANKDNQGKAKHLVVVDEFRSYVKPIWKPELTAFCTSLTGITQVCPFVGFKAEFRMGLLVSYSLPFVSSFSSETLAMPSKSTPVEIA